MELNEKKRCVTFKSLADDLAGGISQSQYEPGNMLPSVRKLAEVYNASVGTVRRAIVELETRGLVRNVPRQGCVVTDQALSVNRKPRNLLVVLSEKHLNLDKSLWGTKIFLGIQSECIDQGFGVIAKIGNNEAELRQSIDDGLFDNIAGMVGLAPVVHPWLLEAVEQADIPYVLFDAEKARPVQNHILTDYFSSARLVGKYFARLGYENVWMLGQTHFQAAHEALYGLQDAYLDVEKSPSCIQFVNITSVSQEGGMEVCRELLNRGNKPDAIFSSNDHVAMGAVKACMQVGLDVPGDVGVVGATGLEQYAHTSPGLSVIAQPMDDIGRMCVREINNLVEGGQNSAPVRKLAGRLILRDTFSPPAELVDELGCCDCYYQNNKKAEKVC